MYDERCYNSSKYPVYSERGKKSKDMTLDMIENGKDKKVQPNDPQLLISGPLHITILLFFFFLDCAMVCGLSVPRQVIKPTLPELEA